MLEIVCFFLTLYLLVLFVRVVLSWFPIAPGTSMATVQDVLVTVTEPVLGPVRRALPQPRMGAMRMDLSPIVVFFGIIIIQGFLCG